MFQPTLPSFDTLAVGSECRQSHQLWVQQGPCHPSALVGHLLSLPWPAVPAHSYVKPQVIPATSAADVTSHGTPEWQGALALFFLLSTGSLDTGRFKKQEPERTREETRHGDASQGQHQGSHAGTNMPSSRPPGTMRRSVKMSSRRGRFRDRIPSASHTKGSVLSHQIMRLIATHDENACRRAALTVTRTLCPLQAGLTRNFPFLSPSTRAPHSCMDRDCGAEQAAAWKGLHQTFSS